MNEARRSTGPKTAAGKARSSQNASKHGLSTPIWNSSGARVSDNTEKLVGFNASAERREAAREFAEAQAPLELVREVCEATIERHGLPAERHGLPASSQPQVTRSSST